MGLLVAIVVTRRPVGRLGRRTLAGLEGAFMLPLGVSAVTVGFGFLIALDRPPLDLRASGWLVPIAQALVALPVVVRLLVPTLAAVDVRQRQAAATLGAGPARVLWTVDVPLVWRPLLAAVGFAFAISMGEFGATSFLVRPDTPTLPILIYRELSHPGRPRAGFGGRGFRAAGCDHRRGHGADRVAALRRGGGGVVTGALEVTGLTVEIDGQVLIDAVDLTVSPGEIMALLGPSGCGKSTLLRAITGLVAPRAGEITFGGSGPDASPRRTGGAWR